MLLISFLCSQLTPAQCHFLEGPLLIHQTKLRSVAHHHVPYQSYYKLGDAHPSTVAGGRSGLPSSDVHGAKGRGSIRTASLVPPPSDWLVSTL